MAKLEGARKARKVGQQNDAPTGGKAFGNMGQGKDVYPLSEIENRRLYLNHRIDFQTARSRVKKYREAWSVAENADGRVRRGLLPPPSTRPTSFGTDYATLQPDANF